jgi:microcystin-dependent protein
MAKNTFNPNTVAKSSEINENFTGTWNGTFMDDNSIDTRHLTAAARGVTGSVIGFAGAGASVPASWLLCNGQAVSRTTYSALFAIIGTTYGVGDGSSTFNVPDLRSRTIYGYNSGSSNFDPLGQKGGEEAHTLTLGEMPTHSHGINDPGHAHTIAVATQFHYLGGAGNSPYDPGGNSAAASYASGTGISIQPIGNSFAHNNMSPFIVMNWIIKT